MDKYTICHSIKQMYQKKHKKMVLSIFHEVK